MRQAPKLGVVLCAQGPSRLESTDYPYINLWKAAWASSMIFSGSTTRALYPHNAEKTVKKVGVNGVAGRYRSVDMICEICVWSQPPGHRYGSPEGILSGATCPV